VRSLRSVLALSLVAFVSASALAKECKTVTGTTSAVLTSESCASPAGLCTQGVLDASFGALKGTFTLTVTSLGVCAENVLCYTGTLLVDANAGTVTFQDTGTLDLLTGVFSSTSTYVSGTGLFEDGAGTLEFEGVMEGTALNGTVSGTICK
jgi:hypothetical protein